MFFFNTVSSLGNAVYDVAVGTVNWVTGNSNAIEDVAKNTLAANENEGFNFPDMSSLASDMMIVSQWKQKHIDGDSVNVNLVVQYIETLAKWAESNALGDPSQKESIIAEAREEIGCILYLADQEDGISSLASTWINPVDPTETRHNVISEVENRLKAIKDGIPSNSFVPVVVAKMLVTQEGIFNALMISIIKKVFNGDDQNSSHVHRILDKMTCGTFNKTNPLALQRGLIDILKAPNEENEQLAMMIRSVFQIDGSVQLRDVHAARLAVACLLTPSLIHTSAETILNRAMRNQESIWLNDLRSLIQEGVIYRQIHGAVVKLPFDQGQHPLEISEDAFPLHVALTSTLAIISEAEKNEVTNKVCRCVKHVLSPFKVVNTKKISAENRAVLNRIHSMVTDEFRKSFQVLYDAKEGYYFLSQKSFDPIEKAAGLRILGSNGYYALTLKVIEQTAKAWDDKHNEIYSNFVFEKMKEFALKPEYIRNSIVRFDPSNKGYASGNEPQSTPWAFYSQNAIDTVLDVYYGRKNVEEGTFEGAVLI